MDAMTQNLLNIDHLRKEVPALLDSWSIARTLDGKLPLFYTRQPIDDKWRTFYSVYETEGRAIWNHEKPIMRIVIMEDARIKVKFYPYNFIDLSPAMISVPRGEGWEFHNKNTEIGEGIIVFETLEELNDLFISIEKYFW